MYASIEVYKKIINGLLERHYGINIDDTALDEEAITENYNNGTEAWELVNIVAEDSDIERIDTGFVFLPRITSGNESEFISISDQSSRLKF